MSKTRVPIDSTRENVGSAVFINLETSQTYELGFSYSDEETPLSRAWDLTNLAASQNGWNLHDVHVHSAK